MLFVLLEERPSRNAADALEATSFEVIFLAINFHFYIINSVNTLPVNFGFILISCLAQERGPNIRRTHLFYCYNFCK